MAKTDRQTDKSTRWAFTAYEDQWSVVDDFSKSQTVADFGYQCETCPKTGKLHRQGYLRTKVQVRFKALIKEFPGIHFEICRNWDALINYCKKEETRTPGEKFISGTGSKEKPLTMAQALIKLVSFAEPRPIMTQITIDNGNDYRYEWNYEYDVKEMYKSAVRNWISVNPDIIALVTQPQYKSAFFDFWQDFNKMAVAHFDEPVCSHSITGADIDGELVEIPEDDFSEYSFID